MKAAETKFLSFLKGQGFGIAILACAAVAFAFPKLFISWGGVKLTALARYSVSREVLGSVLKCETVPDSFHATPKSPSHAGFPRG